MTLNLSSKLTSVKYSPIEDTKNQPSSSLIQNTPREPQNNRSPEHDHKNSSTKVNNDVHVEFYDLEGKTSPKYHPKKGFQNSKSPKFSLSGLMDSSSIYMLQREIDRNLTSIKQVFNSNKRAEKKTSQKNKEHKSPNSPSKRNRKILKFRLLSSYPVKTAKPEDLPEVTSDHVSLFVSLYRHYFNPSLNAEQRSKNVNNEWKIRNDKGFIKDRTFLLGTAMLIIMRLELRPQLSSHQFELQSRAKDVLFEIKGNRK